MRRLAALAVAAFLLAGCEGSSPSDDRSGGATSTSGSTSTSTSRPVTDDGAQVVQPKAGMAGVHPVPFDSAAPTADGRALDVRFTGGVAPCFVLERVGVDERPDAVTVTLFAGFEPGARDVACIEIAAFYATTVALDAPLAGREIVDGARG